VPAWFRHTEGFLFRLCVQIRIQQIPALSTGREDQAEAQQLFTEFATVAGQQRHRHRPSLFDSVPVGEDQPPPPVLAVFVAGVSLNGEWRTDPGPVPIGIGRPNAGQANAFNVGECDVTNAGLRVLFGLLRGGFG
jgi:hypothetical protein